MNCELFDRRTARPDFGQDKALEAYSPWSFQFSLISFQSLLIEKLF